MKPLRTAALITFLFLLSGNPAGADTPHISTRSFSVSADVPVILAASARIINTETLDEADTISWRGFAGSGWKEAGEHIAIEVISNTPAAWRADIYTDNLPAYGYLKGGLINPLDYTGRMPAAWVVSGSTGAVIRTGEPGPLLTSAVTSSAGPLEAGWVFIRDVNDLNNPATQDDESWDTAFSSGYTAVLRGDSGGALLPYGDAPSQMPVRIYLQADFRSAEGGSPYGSVIIIDVTAE